MFPTATFWSWETPPGGPGCAAGSPFHQGLAATPWPCEHLCRAPTHSSACSLGSSGERRADLTLARRLAGTWLVHDGNIVEAHVLAAGYRSLQVLSHLAKELHCKGTCGDASRSVLRATAGRGSGRGAGLQQPHSSSDPGQALPPVCRLFCPTPDIVLRGRMSVICSPCGRGSELFKQKTAATRQNRAREPKRASCGCQRGGD